MIPIHLKGMGAIKIRDHQITHKFTPIFRESNNPRDPITFSDDDWGVQSPPQLGIWVALPFSEGDWIDRAMQHVWLFLRVFTPFGMVPPWSHGDCSLVGGEPIHSLTCC